MKKVLFTVLALAALVLVSSCDKKSNENNPFMSEYANEYGIPPFDKITYGDYMPAVEAGIAEQNAEIDSIIRNTAAPNFENTILALDNSGRILDKVSRVFNALSSSDNTEEMQKLSEDLECSMHSVAVTTPRRCRNSPRICCPCSPNRATACT